jgi:hypothetical protein
MNRPEIEILHWMPESGSFPYGMLRLSISSGGMKTEVAVAPHLYELKSGDISEDGYRSFLTGLENQLTDGLTQVHHALDAIPPAKKEDAA